MMGIDITRPEHTAPRGRYWRRARSNTTEEFGEGGGTAKNSRALGRGARASAEAEATTKRSAQEEVAIPCQQKTTRCRKRKRHRCRKRKRHRWRRGNVTGVERGNVTGAPSVSSASSPSEGSSLPAADGVGSVGGDTSRAASCRLRARVVEVHTRAGRRHGAPHDSRVRRDNRRGAQEWVAIPLTANHERRVHGGLWWRLRRAVPPPPAWFLLKKRYPPRQRRRIRRQGRGRRAFDAGSALAQGVKRRCSAARETAISRAVTALMENKGTTPDARRTAPRAKLAGPRRRRHRARRAGLRPTFLNFGGVPGTTSSTRRTYAEKVGEGRAARRRLRAAPPAA